MATTYGTQVAFNKEKLVWNLYGQFNIGSAGAMNMVPLNSKGIANVWQNTPTFTGVTSSGSSSITSVSSFAGIFTGMTLSSPGASLIATGGATVGTISVSTGTIVMSAAAAAFTGSTGGTLAVQGGQYVIQFGTATYTNGSSTSTQKLDPYNKLLMYNVEFDMSVASASGTAKQAQLAPQNFLCFLTQNNISIRTIPQTSTSASTDASLTIQFGIGGGTSFVAQTPQPGEAVRMQFTLGNSTAV